MPTCFVSTPAHVELKRTESTSSLVGYAMEQDSTGAKLRNAANTPHRTEASWDIATMGLKGIHFGEFFLEAHEMWSR